MLETGNNLDAHPLVRWLMAAVIVCNVKVNYVSKNTETDKSLKLYIYYCTCVICIVEQSLYVRIGLDGPE